MIVLDGRSFTLKYDIPFNYGSINTADITLAIKNVGSGELCSTSDISFSISQPINIDEIRNDSGVITQEASHIDGAIFFSTALSAGNYEFTVYKNTSGRLLPIAQSYIACVFLPYVNATIEAGSIK